MSVLRTTVGSALEVTATVLSAAARVLDTAAKTLRPGTREPQEPRAEPGRVTTDVPPTPMLDDTPHVRTFETHIEELASQPASRVIEAVAHLSTDELRLLTEFELDHKKRRTVLTAIERALAPRPNGSDGDEIVLPEAGGVPTSGTLR